VATLTLFVIRHGDTASTRERRFTGWQDVPLSERGQREAETIAQALGSRGVTAVYSSPLDRSRSTAEVIAKPHRLEVRIDPAFREMGFGAWEGLTVEEVAARFPDEVERWRATPQTVAIDGAERLGDVARRVTAGLTELQAQNAGGTVVLVAHAILIRLLVLSVLGLDHERLWSVDASPAGITELEFTPGWATVHRLNTLAHLDGLVAS
jgi:broad specificity phosphatase PhoE